MRTFVSTGPGRLAALVLLTAATFATSRQARAEIVAGTFDYSNVMTFAEDGSGFPGQLVSPFDGGLQAAAGVIFGDDGFLYVSSRSTGQVLKFNGTTGAPLGPFATLNGSGTAPAGLKFGPDGNLYVADSGSGGNVQRFNGATGAYIDTVTTGMAAAGNLLFGPNGELYAADFGAGSVVRVTNLDTPLQTQETFVQPHAGGLQNPASLLLIPSVENPGTDDLLVVDLIGNSILRYDSTGAPVTNPMFAYIQPNPDFSPLPPPATVPVYISNFPSDIMYSRNGTKILVDVLGKDFNQSGQIIQFNLDGSDPTVLFDHLPAVSSLALTLAPGDTNRDGVADFIDLGVLLNHYDQSGDQRQGDFNGTGVVDFIDLGILLNNYSSAEILAGPAAAVPEPGTLALAALAVVGLLLAARRKR